MGACLVVEVRFVNVDVQAGIFVGEFSDVTVALVAVFKIELHVVEGGPERA